MSCESFLKFGPVISELTGQKTGAFSRISPDILDRFSQSFHRMKALRADDGSIPHFPIFQGTCCENVINAD